MSGYLLDTNVISKFAPGRPPSSPVLQEWMRTQGADDRLFISSMTIAEISKGIRRLERRGAAQKSRGLAEWLEGILNLFDDRILSMDVKVSLLVGEIEEDIAAKGHDPGLEDIIIAATAKANGLTVVTENIRHFSLFGVSVELPAGQ